MPVVNILKSRIQETFPNHPMGKLLEKLPFLGLDIEGIDKEKIRIEYNPNRPDFSSDIGVFRSLKGLLNEKVGLPMLKFFDNKSYKIMVTQNIKKIRPIILFFVATQSNNMNKLMLDQLLSIQEDLHNGIARDRKKASIGIHDLDAIKFPLYYTTKSSNDSFIPLDQSHPLPFTEILSNTDVGKRYGNLLNNAVRYPALIDNSNQILSFPPIINSNKTKVTNKSKNLFIEITGINLDVCKNILAILAYYFYEEGFKISSGIIDDKKLVFSPLKLLKDKEVLVDKPLIDRYLGLDLTFKEIIYTLERSRIGASLTKNKKIKCKVPSYRSDILHPTDIVEEVAIGYGIDNLKPTLPSFNVSVGMKYMDFDIYNKIRETLIGIGFLEMVNFTLIDPTLYTTFNLDSDEISENITVKESKSKEHEILRTNMISSLINNISYNIHEEYPQKIFEIGKTFSFKNSIIERWSLGALIVSNSTNYSEIKSVLQTIFKLNLGKEFTTKKKKENNIFIPGRSADIFCDNEPIGFIGELSPYIITKFNLRLPVAVFEINLSHLLNIMKFHRKNFPSDTIFSSN
jgi:phenylalanyl-tRNA synthetase beta chain